MEEPKKSKIIMVPLNSVSRFKWDKECGDRLKATRNVSKISRRVFAETMAAMINPTLDAGGRLKDDSVSQRYIQRLEEGEIASISTNTLETISQILKISIDDLLDINISVETHR